MLKVFPWNPEAGVIGEDGEVLLKGKPVMVHPNQQPALLQANPNLREYWHLTNHYFYPKNSKGYIYDKGIDVRRFQDEYLDNEDRLYMKDDHSLAMYRDVILNLEMEKLGRTKDPQWNNWTQQYIRISRMMKAAGKDVAIYGTYVGASEFQTWYNLGRYDFRLDEDLNPNFDKQKAHAKLVKSKFLAQEVGLLEGIKTISNRLAPHIDAVVLSCYMPYDIDAAAASEGVLSLDSEAWHSYKSYLQRCISAYKLLYPNKPIYVFIQPNYTISSPRFMPMSDGVWNATLKEVYENKDVDRVYIFTLTSSELPENFLEILTWGPK